MIKACAVWAALSIAATAVMAGPYTEVASGFDQGNHVDVHVSLDYGIDIKRAAILREAVGFPGTDPDDPLPRIKDLLLQSSRHMLIPRIEVGVFTDLSLSLALPLVLSDSRTLSLDQRATPCIFPGSDEEPTCIDRTNSSTIVDGLLPASGFDADNPDGPGFAEGQTIFRGPGRRGVDQIHLGVSWAPMNQDRDDTKPTWKLGAEARLAIGTPMRFDRQDPGSETSVGRGVHEVRLWTSFAKRLGRAEPYVDMWWMAPFATTDDSPFSGLGFGQDRPGSQQQAGAQFGVGVTFLHRPEQHRRVSADISARIEAHFEGQAYSEMWEVFQYAGTADIGGPLVLDRDPTEPGQQVLDHPGVTMAENHVSMGGRLGVQAMVKDNIQLGAAFEIMSSQSHVISFSDAGIDLPTCEGSVTTGCEVDRNDLVNPDTPEVNPGYVPLIDLVGKRYFVDEVADYVFLVDARFLF